VHPATTWKTSLHFYSLSHRHIQKFNCSQTDSSHLSAVTDPKTLQISSYHHLIHKQRSPFVRTGGSGNTQDFQHVLRYSVFSLTWTFLASSKLRDSPAIPRYLPPLQTTTLTQESHTQVLIFSVLPLTLLEADHKQKLYKMICSCVN